MDLGEMGVTDQFVFHFLLDRVDFVHGIPPLPARRREEHELCQRDFWRIYNRQRYSVVCLWEKSLLGTSKGGY